MGESFHAAHDTSRRDDSSRANEIRSAPADRFYKNSFLPCSSRGGYDGSQSRQVVDKNVKLDYLQRKKKPNNTRSVLNLRLETEISRVFPFAADDDGDWAMMNAAIGLFFFLHYTNQITTGAVCLVRLTDRWGLTKTLEFAVSLVCESRWFWQTVSFYRGCLLGLYLDE